VSYHVSFLPKACRSWVDRDLRARGLHAVRSTPSSPVVTPPACVVCHGARRSPSTNAPVAVRRCPYPTIRASRCRS